MYLTFLAELPNVGYISKNFFITRGNLMTEQINISADLNEVEDNVIVDDADPRKYWMQVPNMISKMGLTPHAIALYLHCKCVVGANPMGKCYQSAKTLAANCKMSEGMISKAKTELRDKKLIIVIERRTDRGQAHEIRLIDIWARNHAFCIKEIQEFRELKELKEKELKEKKFNSSNQSNQSNKNSQPNIPTYPSNNAKTTQNTKSTQDHLISTIGEFSAVQDPEMTIQTIQSARVGKINSQSASIASNSSTAVNVTNATTSQSFNHNMIDKRSQYDCNKERDTNKEHDPEILFSHENNNFSRSVESQQSSQEAEKQEPEKIVKRGNIVPSDIANQLFSKDEEQQIQATQKMMKLLGNTTVIQPVTKPEHTGNTSKPSNVATNREQNEILDPIRAADADQALDIVARKSIQESQKKEVSVSTKTNQINPNANAIDKDDLPPAKSLGRKGLEQGTLLEKFLMVHEEAVKEEQEKHPKPIKSTKSDRIITPARPPKLSKEKQLELKEQEDMKISDPKHPDFKGDPADRKRLLDHFIMRTGPAQIPVIIKQQKSITWLLLNGFDVDECIKYFDILTNDWVLSGNSANFRPDWFTVSKSIGSWKMKYKWVPLAPEPTTNQPKKETENARKIRESFELLDQLYGNGRGESSTQKNSSSIGDASPGRFLPPAKRK